MYHSAVFLRFLRFFVTLLLCLRVYEYVMISRYHPGQSIALAEWRGFITDVMLLVPLFILLGLIYLLVRRFSRAWSVALPVAIAGLYFVLAVFILQFFIYQLVPLDKFLFEHTRQEVFFTIKTTEVNYLQIVGFILLSLVAAAFIYRVKDKRSRPLNLMFMFVLLSGIPLFFAGANGQEQEKFILNKPVFFFRSAYAWFTREETNDIEQSRQVVQAYRELFPGMEYMGDSHPFLHKTTENDVLGNWLNAGAEPPNVVVLIVEGLADDFVHPYHGLQLMPFLDSLKNRSLYWDRFFSLGERSYAVTPSLTASLPYGRSGFTMLESQPYHFSWVNVLKQQGYFTSFYYGQGAWFHNKNVYYQQNFIHRIVDKEKFDARYPRILVKEEQDYFWGYDDLSLFEQAMQNTDTFKRTKRLDIFFTGSMHNPFTIQHDSTYALKLQLAAQQTPAEKEFYGKYGKYLRATMFTDDALRKYFSWCRQRPDFSNTVFIITGDHPMTDIPITNGLKRYHVPLIMYSPLLKSPQVFHSVGSHLDVYEPLLVWLKKNHGITIPSVQASLSNLLDTTKTFVQRKPIVFMNGNRDIAEVYDGGYFLTNHTNLYAVDSNFNLKPVKNEKQTEHMQKLLTTFSLANQLACMQGYLLPDTTYFNSLGYSCYSKPAVMAKAAFTNTTWEVIPETRVPNKKMYLDVFVSFDDPSKKPLHGVYQLTNARDSVLLWVSFGIDAGKSRVRYHQPINPVAVSDSTLRFRCYFTNPDGVDYGVSAKGFIFTAND